MKRVGLMGCGVVANYGHMPTIKATEGLELTALFDPDPERLESARVRFGVDKVFTDERDFFLSGIDAVSITSPAPFHLENIRCAAEYGMPVLCEKPLAMNEAECRLCIQASQEAGIQLYTGFDYRFSPVALKIKELVGSGSIGKVLSLRLIYVWNCHGKFERQAGEPVENARRRGRMLEGGPMVDCGVHQIDLARFWLGSEAARWHGVGAWVDEYEAPDHMYLHMDHENGAHTMVEISYSFCHTNRDPIKHFVYELIGTRGLIRYDREARIFEVRNEEGARDLPFAPEKNFAGMYDAFAEALETGRSDTLPTGYDGLMAAKISREATEDAIRNRKSRGR